MTIRTDRARMYDPSFLLNDRCYINAINALLGFVFCFQNRRVRDLIRGPSATPATAICGRVDEQRGPRRRSDQKCGERARENRLLAVYQSIGRFVITRQHRRNVRLIASHRLVAETDEPTPGT